MNKFDAERHLSNKAVLIIQIVFAVVLGESLVILKDVVTRPFTDGHSVAFFALASVYLTTIWSWIDWHELVERMPYKLMTESQLVLPEWRIKVKNFERGRILSDVLIVGAYAYLALTIIPIAASYSANISSHLAGYSIVYVLYYFAGVLRRIVYGKRASRLLVHFSGFVLSFGIFFMYQLAFSSMTPKWSVNAGALLAVLFVTLWYRFVMLPKAAEARRASKIGVKSIGVDIDGVLANQIDGVLERVFQKYGIRMSYESIKQWDQPIDSVSDIKTEILSAMKDSDYVLDMPVHKGARQLLQFLDKRSKIDIITCRSLESQANTELWLQLNGLPYDEIRHVNERKKSLAEIDILVDDYLGNIDDFLANTKRVAFLIEQPWNRDLGAAKKYIDENRLYICHDLLDLSVQLRRLL